MTRQRKRAWGWLLLSLPVIGLFVTCGLSIGFLKATAIFGGITLVVTCLIVGLDWISS